MTVARYRVVVWECGEVQDARDEQTHGCDGRDLCTGENLELVPVQALESAQRDLEEARREASNWYSKLIAAGGALLL